MPEIPYESVGQYIFHPVLVSQLEDAGIFFSYGFTLNAGQKEVEILGRQCSERALEPMHTVWRGVFPCLSSSECGTLTRSTRRDKYMRIKRDSNRGKSFRFESMYSAQFLTDVNVVLYIHR